MIKRVNYNYEGKAKNNGSNNSFKFLDLLICFVPRINLFNHTFNNILTNIFSRNLIWINPVYSGKKRNEIC
jgi:hypothetical protein